MKKLKISLLALSVLAGGMMGASAAAAAKTTYVLSANFALMSWTDGTAKPTAIKTSDVIAALVGATVIETNTVVTTNTPPTTNTVVTTNTLPAFSSHAKLILKKDLTSTNNSGDEFFVRDGTGKNVTDTDVSGFFSVTNTASAKVVAASGKSAIERELVAFEFNAPPATSSAGSGKLSLVLGGFAQSTKGTVPGTTELLIKSLQATVAGTPAGNTNNNVVIQGKFSLVGGKLE